VVTDSFIVRRPVVKELSLNSNSIQSRMSVISDMEAQPVRFERKETPRSEHTNLFTIFSLLNVFIGLYVLFVKVNF
jgi:hypothetical protein